jgi:hypothetical protein
MNAQPNITPSEQPGNVATGGGYVQVHIPQVEAAGTGAFAPLLRSAHKPAPKDRGPEERAKIRDLWTKAKTAAERLWSSTKGDQSGMFGAAVELKDLLARLWELKAHRDDNWVGILDKTQTALDALAAADGGIESATPDQCWKFLQLVETHLSPATKTVDDLKAAVRLLSEMGVSPYAGLEPLGDA